MVFIDANTAINDYALLLTKSALEMEKIIKIIKPLLDNKFSSSVVNRLAVSCFKMRALVNSMQISNILCQHTTIQLTDLNVGTIFNNGNFVKFTRNSKELKYTKLTLETMNKLKLTLEMQPARDPSNCITMVEYKLHPLAGTGPNHNI